MIMRLMRKYLSYGVLVFLLFVISIGLVWNYSGKGQGTAVAVVNNEEITVDRYNRVMNDSLDAQRKSLGHELNDADLAKLHRDVLDKMENETLAIQGMKKLNLAMNSAEVQQTLESVFRDDKGNYSEQRYQQYLQNEMAKGRSIDDIENDIVRSLSLNKVQTFWRDQAILGPTELKDDMARMQRRVKTKLLVWDFKALQAQQKPTEDDMHSFFAENRQSWAKAEQVKARHILIKVDALAGTATAKAKADDLYKKLKAGGDFAKLAEQNSEDEGSAKKGGELGYFSKGDMVPEFEDAAFKLKVGEISQPVLSKFGWHIIKVEDKKAGFDPSFENCHDKIVQGLTLQMAQREANAEASDALKALQGGTSLETAAKGLHAKLELSPSFKYGEKNLLPGLGDSTALSTALLALDPGELLSESQSLDKALVLGGVTSVDGNAPISDLAKLSKLQDDETSRLERARAAALYESWLQSLKAEAKIDDNLDKFYGGTTAN